jgi:hypothetical protein
LGFHPDAAPFRKCPPPICIFFIVATLRTSSVLDALFLSLAPRQVFQLKTNRYLIPFTVAPDQA